MGSNPTPSEIRIDSGKLLPDEAAEYVRGGAYAGAPVINTYVTDDPGRSIKELTMVAGE